MTKSKKNLDLNKALARKVLVEYVSYLMMYRCMDATWQPTVG